MIEQGLTIQDIKEELSKRHIIGHKVKQEKWVVRSKKIFV